MATTKDILEKPLSAFEFTEGFLGVCEQMGFEKLRDITALPREALIHRPGFTFHWLSELITVLEEKEALHLLQGKVPTGNISG
jgi:hypothetical protein